MAELKLEDLPAAQSGVWVRKGYCCRCGECCQAPHFSEEGGPHACQWLKDGNFCTVYTDPTNRLRQDVCAIWPRFPQEIEGLSRCTYYFEWQPDAK